MKKSFKMLKILALCIAPVCMTGCFGGGSGTNTNSNTNSNTNTNTENTNTNTNTEKTDDKNKTEEKEVAVTSVTFDKTTADLKVGDTLTLNATVAPSNATKPELTWSTSKSSVAKVNNGVVEAVAAGTATIKAKTSNGKYAECTVSVTDYSVTSVVMNIKELTMEVRTTFQLSATVLPEDAENKTLTWTSNYETRATVNDSGLVSALKAGSVTITAKSSNKKSDTCKITIVDTPIITDKKFANECTYIYSGQYDFLDQSITYDTRYNFKPDGTVKIKDTIAKTENDRTYKIDDGMLYVYDGEEIYEMFFYYHNVLLSASLIPVSLVKDGSGVSEKTQSTLGYYSVIETSVGSSLGVLTGEEGSAGYYAKLQENGKLANKLNYINSDQITSSVWDSYVSKAGTYIVKVNISGALYNCLLIVK